MTVIELEIVSFAEAHHWRLSGAVIDFAGLELFEEVFFESRDFGVEVFARAQEKPDDERLEKPDADIAVSLAGRFSAGIDPVNVILHAVVERRQEIVHDEGGSRACPRWKGMPRARSVRLERTLSASRTMSCRFLEATNSSTTVEWVRVRRTKQCEPK